MDDGGNIITDCHYEYLKVGDNKDNDKILYFLDIAS